MQPPRKSTLWRLPLSCKWSPTRMANATQTKEKNKRKYKKNRSIYNDLKVKRCISLRIESRDEKSFSSLRRELSRSVPDRRPELRVTVPSSQQRIQIAFGTFFYQILFKKYIIKIVFSIYSMCFMFYFFLARAHGGGGRPRRSLGSRRIAGCRIARANDV